MVTITGPDTGTVRLPITQSQAGLLVIDRMIATRHIYNGVAEVDLAPGLTEARVRAALATTVALQPALCESATGRRATNNRHGQSPPSCRSRSTAECPPGRTRDENMPSV